VPILIELVKTHKRPGVRKKAMFWLAQTGDPRALDLIEEILGVR
jgi:HEAT repeat protein